MSGGRSPIAPASSRCYWVAKRSTRVEEWRDAWSASEARARFALADGASNRSFASHDWGHLLTQTFVEDPPKLSAELPTTWFEMVSSAWQLRRADADNELKRAAFDGGSYATFLGVQFHATPDGLTWDALAVGDTCLFHLRDRNLLASFPLQCPQDFNDQPELVASRPDQVRRSVRNMLRVMGSAEAGDVFLLATDEMARWSLAAAASDPKVWEVLGAVGHGDFERMISSLRDAGAMKPDDVTFMRLTVG
jgi:hypothetical protein